MDSVFHSLLEGLHLSISVVGENVKFVGRFTYIANEIHCDISCQPGILKSLGPFGAVVYSLGKRV